MFPNLIRLNFGHRDGAAHNTAIHLGDQWSGFVEVLLLVVKYYDR